VSPILLGRTDPVPDHINEEVVAMAFVGRTDVKDPGAQQHQWEKSGLAIPQVSKGLICKYLTDLNLIGALEK